MRCEEQVNLHGGSSCWQELKFSDRSTSLSQNMHRPITEFGSDIFRFSTEQSIALAIGIDLDFRER